MNKYYLFVIILIFACLPVFAQNTGASAQGAAEELFFIAPLFETLGYSDRTIAYGGGLAIGTGSGTAFGLRLLYNENPEDFTFLEILIFIRYYFSDTKTNIGPFVQFNAGPVLYTDNLSKLKGYGNISAGITGGWRFPLGKNFFAEPAVRLGFPYIIGAGVSAGYRY